MADVAVVLGGGLSGMAAANTVMENGGRIVLLDKSAFCGGNSTKATSGINGANTKTQRAQGIEDSVELFSSDCLKGGAKKPELVKVLAENSGPDCDWLMDVFGLDLSLVARLGGHSAPRTHRGKERFPGMTITYALIQMVEKIAERGDKAKVITKARAHTLVLQNERVVGVQYEKGGTNHKQMGPVIIATGGFGADFSNDSLLAKYRPDLMHLPTSNGEHCTGDGIKMGTAIGAKTIDLEWVQVHPTGLVNPKDPDAKVKFLAAEALRGVGGLVFDANGRRFANELGRRDYVTGEMWKNKGPFRLCLNKAASDEIIWHCKHYTGRGVMKYYKSGKDLADEMGVPVSVMAEEVEKHYQAGIKMEKDPEGGPYPAYPSGRCWDEASGKTGSGKKFYHNMISGAEFATQEYYVAIITPIIHYCMGGLEITVNSEVLGANGFPIPGLYCAGEVMGGVHGNNRLGGNSLLDCVVYGRVAGKACAKYMLGKKMKDVSLKELSGGGIAGGGTNKSALSGGSYEDIPAGATTAAAGQVLDLTEVAKHNTEQDCWVVVNNQVLDVTKFLPDHPGGALAILTFAGKDATEEFNMIHPPDVISKYAPDAIIGTLGGTATGASKPGNLSTPLLKNSTTDNNITNEHAWGAWREEGKGENPGVFGRMCNALLNMASSFLLEIFMTLFTVSNFKFTNDRSGLTRSALFLIFFMIIHSVGNLHIFLGPDDFNGYGYFYKRFYWTMGGLVDASIIEVYLAMAIILHVSVALKRTWDINRNFQLNSGKLNLAITGLVLLSFMSIHLNQFRFAKTDNYLVRPPPYLINFSGIPKLQLFWTSDTSVEPIQVRDIYKLEFELFSNPFWALYYLLCTTCFLLHGAWGWAKVVPSTMMNIPKGHHKRVTYVGYILVAMIAACYFSFPIYCLFFNMKKGANGVS